MYNLCYFESEMTQRARWIREQQQRGQWLRELKDTSKVGGKPGYSDPVPTFGSMATMSRLPLRRHVVRLGRVIIAW